MSYEKNFLGDYVINTPALSESEQKKFQDAEITVEEYYLDYVNYSVLQNPRRKFPYFSASNIDGTQFQTIARKEVFDGKGDRWRKDKRIPGDAQFGSELYSADMSHFDRGHLTKREDVQWGDSKEIAKEGAASTFYFTNAAPQVDRLNRGVWKKIEDYILHQEVIEHGSKITLFTGPVFLENDPYFVTKVRNQDIQLPTLFWKVIYYIHGGELYHTAFLTSQKTLLEKRRIVKPTVRSKGEREDQFMRFKDAETYQVQVDFIEKLSGLSFTSAKENFKRTTPEKLLMSGIEVRSEGGEGVANIRNLTL